MGKHDSQNQRFERRSLLKLFGVALVGLAAGCNELAGKPKQKVVCMNCGGLGYITRQQGYYEIRSACLKCNGRGTVTQ